jgi:hypothetical protein
LASRSMASHAGDEMIWMSRFDYPHELCHISKSEIKLPSNGNKTNWPLFRHALLDPEDPGFDDLRLWWDGRERIWEHYLHWWKNRQQICHITKHLAEKLHTMTFPDLLAGTKLGNDPFSIAPFRRKVIRTSSFPTTKRNRITFTEGLELLRSAR